VFCDGARRATLAADSSLLIRGELGFAQSREPLAGYNQPGHQIVQRNSSDAAISGVSPVGRRRRDNLHPRGQRSLLRKA
jgi:hypothetical protein